MFWDKLIELCNLHNTTPNAVCKNLGFSNATATKWKNGSHPRDTAIKKICDYFKVDDNYFKNPSAKFDFSYAAYDELTHDLSQEQIEQLKSYAKFLRSQSKNSN